MEGLIKVKTHINRKKRYLTVQINRKLKFKLSEVKNQKIRKCKIFKLLASQSSNKTTRLISIQHTNLINYLIYELNTQLIKPPNALQARLYPGFRNMNLISDKAAKVVFHR